MIDELKSLRFSLGGAEIELREPPRAPLHGLSEFLIESSPPSCSGASNAALMCRFFGRVPWLGERKGRYLVMVLHLDSEGGPHSIYCLLGFTITQWIYQAVAFW